MEEISLREIIEVILKSKWLIAIVTVVCLIFGTIGTMFLAPTDGTAKEIIQMGFKGIGDGLNPDGTKFDINMIKDPVVVQKTIDSLGLEGKGITIEAIRRNLDTEPIVPKAIVDKIAAMQKDGKDYTYHPSQFIISMNISKPDKIDEKLGKEILDAIVQKYSEHFSDLYSDRTTLANALGVINYDQYDYPEISTVMRSQLDTMQNLLTAKNKEAGEFRSKKTGLSFNDIIESLGVIDKVELSRMDSIIGANNLTKDKDKLITKYQYSIKMNTLDSSKKSSEAKIAKDMMGNYKQDKNTILIPGLTPGLTDDQKNNTELQNQNNNTYYDSLAQRSTDAGVEAQNKLYDNEFIKQEIQRLQNDKVSQEEKAKAEKDVITLIGNLKVELQHWIDLTNDTLLEYYQMNYDKAIMPISPVDVGATINLKLILAVSLVIGLMLGTFIGFFREYWRSSGNQRPKENVG